MTAPIQLPNCPRCRQPPRFTVSDRRAFCRTTTCDVLSWDMTSTQEDFDLEVSTYDLEGES